MWHVYFCYADGGFFSSYESDIIEPSQKGVIIYENGIETLILQAGFRGDAQEFAWVIPVPAQPTLSDADEQIFFDLHELTKPETKNSFWSFDGCYGEEESLLEDEGVTIVSMETVGIYETTTLSATNPRALANWLNEHGYYMPPHAEDIVSSYVEEGWYFIAMKIQQSPNQRIRNEGGIQPISLSFSSDKIVYPMKITAVSTSYTQLLLYVLAQHKMTFQSAELEYADWLSEKEVSYLRTIKTPVKHKMYLTKLRAHLYKRDMMDDIYLSQAKDDKSYREVIYVRRQGGIDVCLAMCGLFLLIIRKNSGTTFNSFFKRVVKYL